MGSDVGEIPSPRDIKVHRLICMDLIKFVTRVSLLLPAIEAARPRCNSGIQVLCLLNKALDKAKNLLFHCSESSKLYLALTGDVILSRCKKTTNLLEQSLSEMQNMVPVMLAAEIAQLAADLRAGTFSLDPSEEEAKKVLKKLLHQYASTTDSGEENVFEAIQIAMLRLHITSPKILLIEKRSIKKQLEKVGEDDQSKRKILLLFLNLLNKYGKSIVKEQTENGSLQHVDSVSLGNRCEVESHLNDAQKDILNSPLLPDEFRCPLSWRLMYDPVVIASGQTYERCWIEKWYAEGNDTCPKTKRKLVHLSLTPNNAMKDLISRWSAAHGISVLDPSVYAAAIGHSRESSFTSIASLSNSMNDLYLPMDFSNLSLGSSGAGLSSDLLHVKTRNDFDVVSPESSRNFHNFQSGGSMHHRMELEPLARLNSLSWESQCNLVGSIGNILKQNVQACNWMSSENFIQKLCRFLKDAYESHDLDAQLLGCQSLVAVLDNCRSSIPYLNDDAFAHLTSLLGSEAYKEALNVIEVLSRDQNCHPKIAASGALTAILDILDAIHSRELQEPAIKILCNMSESSKLCSLIAPSELVPKLVPFLEDVALARDCVTLLKKLCINEDARIAIAETDGCIASIVKLLERDSRGDQEHAVALLLFLCSQRVQYCQLVMDEGVIPELVTISINGNNKAKAMALELLRLLRDEFNDIAESFESSDVDIPKGPTTIDTTQQKSCSKSTGIFGKLFTKRGPSTAKRIK